MRDAVEENDGVDEALTVEEGVRAAVRVPDCVGEFEEVAVTVGAGVRDPLKDALSLLDGEAPLVREAVGDAETVLLAESVEVRVAVDEAVLVAVEELDGVPVPLCVAVTELLSELEPVLDAEAPSVTEPVVEEESVLLLLTVVLAVAFPVPLPEGVVVPVGVAEGVTEPVGDAVIEMVPVLEEEAPTVTDPVGLCDSVELALSVDEDVCVAEPVPEFVAVLDGVPVTVGAGVREPLKDALPLLEDDAPVVIEAEGGTELVLLVVIVEVGVGVGVPLLVAVEELDGVLVLVCVAVAELLKEIEPVLEADAPEVKDAVGEVETVLLQLTVVLDVVFPVPLPVGVGLPLGVEEGVAGPVWDAVMEIVPVLEAEAPIVTEPVGLCERVVLLLSVEVGVAEGLSLPVVVTELEGVPEVV